LFVDLVTGFEAILACMAFGPYATGFSPIVAYLVICTSAVELFENTTVFGSGIVQFAVSAGVSLIVVAILFSAIVSTSMITSASSEASSVASTREEG